MTLFHHPDPSLLEVEETDSDDPRNRWVLKSSDPAWIALSIRKSGIIATFPTAEAALKWKRRALRHLPVLPERACGDCDACCTPLAVQSLDKPAGVPCQHLCAPHGCGIYEARPQVCKDYFCGWRLGVGFPQDRPDRVGLLFTPRQNLSIPLPGLQDASFIVHEIKPDARLTPLGKKLIRTVASRGFLVFVLTPDGFCRSMHGPPQLLRSMARWCESNKRLVPFGILEGYDL